jgi:hypothetical protein
MRCPQCGFRNPRARERCSRCGEQLQLSPAPSSPSTIEPEADDAPNLHLESESIPNLDGSAPFGPLAGPSSLPVASGSTPTLTTPVPLLQRRAPQLEGTVIAADPPHHEPPDFDLARTLNRVLLFVEFLVLPVALLWGLLNFFGPFSFVLGILGIYLLFKFISPLNLLAMVGIFRMFNPARHQDEQIPVQYVRLRDRTEREHIVRCKGHLRGHLMPGDEVALWGRWRRGLFEMSGGVNRRTGAQLSVESRASWLWLVLNAIVLAGLIGLFQEPVRQTLTSLSP